MVYTDSKTSEGIRGNNTYAGRNFWVVGAPFIEKNAKALVTGKPVLTDDLALKECLVVKVLRSPYAHAMVRGVDCGVAAKIPGIERILTWKDMPQNRFTMTGQTYPEPSPYDRLILDRRLRFTGDAVAIMVGRGEAAVDHAMRLVHVKYEVLGPMLDMHDAKDGNVLMHPGEDWKSLCDVGADNRHNLCASDIEGHGNPEQVFTGCTHMIERVYHTKTNQRVMMETFRTFAHMDMYERLNVVASTQIPSHTRRVLARVLDIPKSRICVIKPRIGDGFEVKQTTATEIYPAIVTWKTGKPAKIIYSRYKSQIASSPRHEMEVQVKLRCDDSDILRAMDVYTLSSIGTHGKHGPTTVDLSGHRSVPLYHAPEAFRFGYDVVYTNRMSAGAYCGYGATRGIFTVESAVSELVAKLGIDPVRLGEPSMVKEGDAMPAYYGEATDGYALDHCVARVKDMIGWNGKYPKRQVSGSKMRGAELAMVIQDSSISGVDVAGTTTEISDDGLYDLVISAADMGTGYDTTLAQVAAECLGCELDDIMAFGANTDISPYDSGSYVSSTAYLIGTAVVKTCEALRERILRKVVKYLETRVEELELDGERVYKLACGEDGTKKEISTKDLTNRVQCANEDALQVTQSHSSPMSPPPSMTGTVEVEVDLEAERVELVKLAATADYRTPLNGSLTRVRTEDGLVQRIDMALYEDVGYSKDGKVHENSFVQYEVPSRLDVGRVQMKFESSFKPTGPFGAKSIGGVVISTPSPATTSVVYNAVGMRIRELPITAEKVFKGMNGLG